MNPFFWTTYILHARPKLFFSSLEIIMEVQGKERKKERKNEFIYCYIAVLYAYG